MSAKIFQSQQISLRLKQLHAIDPCMMYMYINKCEKNDKHAMIWKNHLLDPITVLSRT